eukprot:jgi/Undpi1/5674/HiC_scaffold_2.g00948.m1
MPVIGPGARKASPPWLLAITNYFNFRWCVIAPRKQKLIPSWIDHFELELYDVVYDITSKLGLVDQLFSAVAPRAVAKGGLQKAPLPTVSAGASLNQLVPGSGWRCRRGRSCSAAAVTIDSIKRLQEHAGDGDAPCGIFFSRASTPLAVGFRQHATTCQGEHRPLMPSCGADGSVDRGWGGGGWGGGGCIEVTVEAVVGPDGGLCGGSGASDGGSGARYIVLLVGARRCVNQAHAGAAVGAKVTAAAGSLPRGSKASGGVLLADTGRRVCQAHAGSAVKAAVTAAGGGLPHGSTASDGALLADAEHRVYQALTVAAVGTAVVAAEGSLPHRSRASDGSLLADAGRRVYPRPTRGVLRGWRWRRRREACPVAAELALAFVL